MNLRGNTPRLPPRSDQIPKRPVDLGILEAKLLVAQLEVTMYETEYLLALRDIQLEKERRYEAAAPQRRRWALFWVFYVLGFLLISRIQVDYLDARDGAWLVVWYVVPVLLGTMGWFTIQWIKECLD
jgi:hypothetical protein